MIWLAWRQLRTGAVVAVVGLAAFGTWVWATGRGLTHEYDAGLATCKGGGCSAVMDAFVTRHQGQMLALVVVVLALPALLGLFWGAPLIARELDAGTHRLAWNQSVTRTRWLTVKLLMVGAACAAVSGLVVWWVGRWSGPIDLASAPSPRLPWAITFASSGIGPVAYAVFAFALGVAAGMVTKRIIAAMTITLVVFVSVQITVALLVRPHLVPTDTSVAPITSRTVHDFNLIPGAVQLDADAPVKGSWLISKHLVDSSGARVDNLPAAVLNEPACTRADDPGQDITPCLALIASQGYRQESTYLPPSKFSRLRWTEAGLYAAATAGLVGCCFWWLRRRVV